MIIVIITDILAMGVSMLGLKFATSPFDYLLHGSVFALSSFFLLKNLNEKL